MADIRINSLPSTATSFNTDDYIAIDGASGGTRKMLAATLPLTDVTLGASGPSVKSTLSARAPRQGLVFDGMAGATIGTFSNWGTADFSICAWIRPSLSANAYILTPTSGSDMYFTVNSNGTLRVSSGGFTQDLTSTGTVSANKWALVSYVRSGTTATFYINGITAGTGTDSFNWGRVTGVGSSGYVGTIAPVYPYNRALSASEVVALYEAGAPSGADYNSASNTAFNTSNFVEAIAYTTFTGVSATGFSATQTGAVTSLVVTKPNITINAGNRVLVTFTGTLTSGAVPNVALVTSANGVASNISAVAAGSNSVVLTATAPCVGVGFYTTGAATSYAISNVVATRQGLLLAPDAAQAGGGLVWYDTSGNAANITLPASGVSWNVPSSRVLGGNWTVSGTSKVGGGSNDVIKVEADTAGNGGYLMGRNAADTDYTPLILIGNGLTLKRRSGVNSSTNALAIDTSGNTTLSGNLTVSGTGTSSVAGKLQLGATTATGYNTLLESSGITTGRGLYQITSTGAWLIAGIEASAGGTTLTGSTAYASYLGSFTNTPLHLVSNSTIGATLTNGGNYLIGTTIDNSATFASNRTGTGPASSGAISTAAIRAVDVSNDLALDIGVNSAASPYPGWIQVHGRTNQATNYPLALNPNGGNLLIGTTIDGGQKLQVSGSGFISGSLAVGDRAAPAGVSLRVQQAGSDDVGLEWQRTSATNGILLSYNRATSAYTSLSYGASSHTFTISGTTALTLDSSQNATFAGKVGIGASPLTPLHVKGNVVSNRGVLMVQDSSGSGASSYPVISLYDSADSERGSVGLYGNDFKVINKISGNLILATNNTTALTLASTGNATFAGDITISSAYPKINLSDTNNDSDFSVLNDNGRLAIYDETNAAYRFTVGATGGIKVGSTPEDVGANNFKVQGDTIIATKTPASASATGTAGTIAWDASYIYVCTATNTWKRVAIATWP